MLDTEKPTEELFADRGDWPSATVCLIFLVGIPIAIAAMEQEPREIAPLKYLVPFAAIFALILPFLWKSISNASARYHT